MNTRRFAVIPLLLLLFVTAPARADPILLFGGLISVGKNADRMELRGGLLSNDTGIESDRMFKGVVLNGEFLFRSPEFLSFVGSPRPYVGARFSLRRHGVHFFYAGLNWDVYAGDRFYITASLGGSIHTADNLINPVNYNALGCRALFHLGLGAGFDITEALTVQVFADHFSNARLCEQNRGNEAVGVRVGYRF